MKISLRKPGRAPGTAADLPTLDLEDGEGATRLGRVVSRGKSHIIAPAPGAPPAKVKRIFHL